MIAPLVIALLSRISDPCVLLDPHDIARVLGWTVTSGALRSYALPGGAGKMCTFDGRDGTVIVTIPSKGTGLPVNDLTSDLGTQRTPLHDAHGLSLPTEFGRDSAISVQPIDAQFADEAQMRALVTALVAHLPRRRTGHV